MKKVFWLSAGILMVAVATPAFAQEAGGGSGMGVANWVAITSGFAMAIASAFCGLAQGRATAAAVEAMARNPGAAGAIRIALILGLALIESLALYTLVIIFAKVT
ncbi:MAG TPA: ATP synthase F0 subunit C [Terriglobia bacterium]|jgi:F-type H+-transporting ATPase subunit c